MTETKFARIENLSPEELVAKANSILSIVKLGAINQEKEVGRFSADSILEKAWGIAAPMVEEIEGNEPGHMAGLNKVKEMKELAENSETIGRELGFDGENLQLLKIILGTHDLGRYVEKTLNLHTMRTGVRHGALSLLFLAENNLLEGLSDKEKYIVLFSVYYHAEKDVPKPSEDAPEFEKMAYEMCYVLRDLDKEHTLDESKYYEPVGVLVQLNAHYLSEDSKVVVNGNNELSKSIEMVLGEYLSGSPVADHDIPENILEEIKKIMGGKVHPDILKAYELNESADLRLLKYSWSSYMAFRLTMLFDIKNDAILKNIVSNDRDQIEKSIEYIERHDNDAAKVVVDNLNKYLIERLGQQINF